MENNKIIKDIAVSTTKEIAKDVYEDTVHPVAKDVGGILETFSGFFNHVVMYPLKKLNTIYEQKDIAFEKQIEQKYNTIPEENRTEPQLHIVGPTMESLKYNIMDDNLSELFSNLLVSNMDNRTQNLCTPAFVTVIGQLSPNDAKTFVAIYSRYKQTSFGPICELKFVDRDNTKRQLNQKYYPRYFLEVLPDHLDMMQASKSIQNLERLGLFNINFLKWINDDSIYTSIADSKFAKKIIEVANGISGKNYDVKIESKGIITLNDFSMDFAKVCLR